MCTYLTTTADVHGSASTASGWIDVRQAVVSFDHPQEVSAEHAVCIDLRAADGNLSSRVAVELDAASARRLAAAILATLDSEEVRELTD